MLGDGRLCWRGPPRPDKDGYPWVDRPASTLTNTDCRRPPRWGRALLLGRVSWPESSLRLRSPIDTALQVTAGWVICSLAGSDPASEQPRRETMTKLGTGCLLYPALGSHNSRQSDSTGCRVSVVKGRAREEQHTRRRLTLPAGGKKKRPPGGKGQARISTAPSPFRNGRHGRFRLYPTGNRTVGWPQEGFNP